MTRCRFLTCAAICFCIGIAACRSGKPRIDPGRLGMFQKLPATMDSASNPASAAKVDLGRMLYYEPRLSRAHDVSCNTCHPLSQYGVDGEPVSTGFRGQKGARNAPTVFNAAGHLAQFWDGRAATIEDQAKGPILNPVEMAMTDEKRVVAILKSIPEYVDGFRKAFPDDKDPVTYDNLAKAIGAFERGLVTTSRWDKFLGGDQTALTEAETEGLNQFLEAGCQSCHAGVYLGGSAFQKLGAAVEWPDSRDLGRFAVTKQAADRMVFKVPTLRNVEKTAPYYHDGSVKTLEEAVTKMGQHQLGRQLTAQQVASIVTFLKNLTGDVPGEYIRQPTLPPSTRKTPKPEA